MGRDEVLACAYFVLQYCDGAWSRDEQGYDVFDAVTVRLLLSPDVFGDLELHDDEIEYLRQKLLRYRTQIRTLALEEGRDPAKVERTLKELERPLSEEPNLIKVHLETYKGTVLHGRINPKNLKRLCRLVFLEGAKVLKLDSVSGFLRY